METISLILNRNRSVSHTMSASTNTITFQAPPGNLRPVNIIFTLPVNLVHMTCFIVAGNYDEYKNYIKEKGTDNLYVYVYSPDQLRGLRDIKGFYIGSWRNRRDIEEIKMIIHHSKTQNANVL